MGRQQRMRSRYETSEVARGAQGRRHTSSCILTYPHREIVRRNTSLSGMSEANSFRTSDPSHGASKLQHPDAVLAQHPVQQGEAPCMAPRTEPSSRVSRPKTPADTTLRRDTARIHEASARPTSQKYGRRGVRVRRRGPPAVRLSNASALLRGRGFRGCTPHARVRAPRPTCGAPTHGVGQASQISQPSEGVRAPALQCSSRRDSV